MTVSIQSLTPHPDAAAFWERGGETATEDELAIREDVRQYGIREPLDVWESDGTLWVVDGVSRLHAATAIGLEEVPIRHVTIDPQNGGVPAYVLSKNAMRHRLSTGQRVLNAIAQSKDAVLEAWRSGSKNRSGDCPHSATALALRLGTSSKDTLAGIELMAAVTDGGMPNQDATGRNLVIPCQDPDHVAAIRQVFDDVLRGRTPVRRWKTAVAGIVSTSGQQRAAIDHAGKLLGGAKTLNRHFAEQGVWYTIDPQIRSMIIAELVAVVQSAPEEVYNAVQLAMRQIEGRTA